ncbi:hypothetical protein ACLK19_03895 [Escherichia coli]
MKTACPFICAMLRRSKIGPEMRPGIADETAKAKWRAGGDPRSGKSCREAIAAAKDKTGNAESSLPEGVEIVTRYDCSQLIDRASQPQRQLLEEFIVVAVVCALFLGTGARAGGVLFRCRWGCVLLLLSCTSRD